jgi:hypothetical protein
MKVITYVENRIFISWLFYDETGHASSCGLKCPSEEMIEHFEMPIMHRTNFPRLILLDD